MMATMIIQNCMESMNWFDLTLSTVTKIKMIFQKKSFFMIYLSGADYISHLLGCVI
jgi:hypothetical protein